MDILLNLLERKNLCFRSFNRLCFEFLDEIAKSDTSNLDEFQRKRDCLIKVLEQLEFEVNHFLRDLGSDYALPKDVKNKIDLLLREKDGLVKQILDADLQILSHIDRIKDETIKKLQGLNSSRKTVTAYRSPLDAVEAAEGKNKIVDQEA